MKVAKHRSSFILVIIPVIILVVTMSVNLQNNWAVKLPTDSKEATTFLEIIRKDGWVQKEDGIEKQC